MTATAKHSASSPESNGAFTKNPNLGGFDDFAKALVRRAITAGWLARRSSKGHMLLYAPDGKMTTSISRDMSAPRVRKNAENPIRAWEEKSKITLPASIGGTFVCPNPAECGGFHTDKRMAMVAHLTHHHGPDRRCVLCNRKFSGPASYARHMRTHEDELQVMDIPVVESPAEPARPAEPAESAEESAVAAEAAELSLPVLVPTPLPEVLQIGAGPTNAESVDEDSPDFTKWSSAALRKRMLENIVIAEVLERRLDDKAAHIQLAREALNDLDL